MRCVKVKGQNADFGKPKNWNDAVFGPCGSLPLRREVVGSEGAAYTAHYSNWKPSTAELAALNAGGVVQLECCGVQPAVSVAVVPCADPDADPAPITEKYLRNLLADEFARLGRYEGLTAMIRDGSDNSHGGEAALAALRRVTGFVCRCEGSKAGHEPGCPLS